MHPYHHIIYSIYRIYRQLNRHLAHFRRASELRCPALCGKCCHSPRVEATVTELFPIARRFARLGTLAAWTERARPRADGFCLFFEPVPGSETQGRCGIYRYRPLACRLYGFSGRQTKTGQEFNACPTMTAAFPDAVASARAITSAGDDPVLMGDYSIQIAALDPAHARGLPINTAFLRAASITLSREHYENPAASQPPSTADAND